MSSHGLESRSPYLDKEFTKLYLSIPIEYRKNAIPKHFIRTSFEIMDKDILPSSILWRQRRNKILQERVTILDLTKDKNYYKDLFTSYYPECVHLIPYYWKPRFITTIDLYNRNIVYEYFYMVKHFFTGKIMNMFRKFFF